MKNGFARMLCAIISTLILSFSFPAREQPGLDVLIKRGKVIDGSGSAPVITDVGIKGDRIVFIGDAAKEKISAARTIDAAGLAVAPGFIDPHTHTLEDLSNADRKSNENYLMQGVTTVITGNDGAGPIRVRETLDGWRERGIGTN